MSDYEEDEDYIEDETKEEDPNNLIESKIEEDEDEVPIRAFELPESESIKGEED